MDLSLDVTEKALEVAKCQIEEAATHAKDLASRQLLQEVAEEKAAKKVTTPAWIVKHHLARLSCMLQVHCKEEWGLLKVLCDSWRSNQQSTLLQLHSRHGAHPLQTYSSVELMFLEGVLPVAESKPLPFKVALLLCRRRRMLPRRSKPSRKWRRKRCPKVPRHLPFPPSPHFHLPSLALEAICTPA